MTTEMFEALYNAVIFPNHWGYNWYDFKEIREELDKIGNAASFTVEDIFSPRAQKTFVVLHVQDGDGIDHKLSVGFLANGNSISDEASYWENKILARQEDDND